jgi:heat shock protein HslJ
MTGMPYPLTAALDVLDPPGAGLTGCAGDPLDLLQGDWTVIAIGDAEVARDVPVTIGVEGNRIAGQSGCNRYVGTLSLTGEGLRAGPVGVTRKACTTDRMTTERMFLETLATVDRFDLRDDGMLLLMSANRPVIVGRR